ncbi:hypothetical protein QS306_13605 [Paraburkholderia bonniea]|uniref:hypothetical protein n=1 Tax=Paraburkholderia bonniea TaxID=2152891 RepID=UPI001291EF4A|nr:hypothetical protein [Paraburkholderia bonniea]WJF90109.1 hypothetical protein QS306_13605 [Paraburkholderia bonniea]WJF93423.1 hypothetical protein QS308_13615 [Paraburkholderia bonniea]
MAWAVLRMENFAVLGLGWTYFSGLRMPRRRLQQHVFLCCHGARKSGLLPEQHEIQLEPLDGSARGDVWHAPAQGRDATNPRQSASMRVTCGTVYRAGFRQIMRMCPEMISDNNRTTLKYLRRQQQKCSIFKRQKIEIQNLCENIPGSEVGVAESRI